MAYSKLVFRVHAIQRMFLRHLTPDDVRTVLAAGEVIREYPDDTPYPSRFVLAYGGGRPVHVVAADDARRQETIVITVYEPDPALWAADFRRKKR